MRGKPGCSFEKIFQQRNRNFDGGYGGEVKNIASRFVRFLGGGSIYTKKSQNIFGYVK